MFPLPNHSSPMTHTERHAEHTNFSRFTGSAVQTAALSTAMGPTSLATRAFTAGTVTVATANGLNPVDHAARHVFGHTTQTRDYADGTRDVQDTRPGFLSTSMSHTRTDPEGHKTHENHFNSTTNTHTMKTYHPNGQLKEETIMVDDALRTRTFDEHGNQISGSGGCSMM